MSYPGYAYGQGQGWGGVPAPQPQGAAYGGHQGAPPSDHYGSYGHHINQNAFSVAAWQALQFNSDEELRYLFESNKSQKYQGIQAEELCKIMNNSPRIREFYRVNWSLELCKIMLSMLDRSRDGIMQYPEFCELLQCLTYWYQTFGQYDSDRSGYIEPNELFQCIQQRFGYRLSHDALTTLLKRYSKVMDDGRALIAFDDFVSVSVRLRAYTEAFRARDRQINGRETGNCTFGYDDFIRCVMCL